MKDYSTELLKANRDLRSWETKTLDGYVETEDSREIVDTCPNGCIHTYRTV